MRPLCASWLLLTALTAVGQVAAPVSSSNSKVPDQSQPGSSSRNSTKQIEVLTDTMGVDFGPYLNTSVLTAIRYSWYRLIPSKAMPPLSKQGHVAIELSLQKSGKVTDMVLASSSGDIELDRAAWGAITASSPFPHLPAEFKGNLVSLRMHFYYNPASSKERGLSGKTWLPPADAPLCAADGESEQPAPIEILTSGTDKDIDPYRKSLLPVLSDSWYSVFPYEPIPAMYVHGVVTIEVEVQADGKISKQVFVCSSGEELFDRVAWNSITRSILPVFPRDFKLTSANFQVKFHYNLHSMLKSKASVESH